MLESLLEKADKIQKKVIFIQCTKTPNTHAMKNYIDDLSNPTSKHTGCVIVNWYFLEIYENAILASMTNLTNS